MKIGILTPSEQLERLLISMENHHGDRCITSILDDHVLHIREHRKAITEIRKRKPNAFQKLLIKLKLMQDIELKNEKHTQSLLAHIQEHLDYLNDTSLKPINDLVIKRRVDKE